MIHYYYLDFNGLFDSTNSARVAKQLSRGTAAYYRILLRSQLRLLLVESNNKTTTCLLSLQNMLIVDSICEESLSALDIPV